MSPLIVVLLLLGVGLLWIIVYEFSAWKIKRELGNRIHRHTLKLTLELQKALCILDKYPPSEKAEKLYEKLESGDIFKLLENIYLLKEELLTRRNR